MYETVRELIAAENRIPGVLAGLCECPDPSGGQMKIKQAVEGGRVDPMFPELRTQDWGWAQKWADIHMIHTTIPKQVGELKPKAFFAHGTPEACMTMDVERNTESFTPAADWINRCEASFVTSHRALECWSPFDYTGSKIHLINKGIDLDWWQRATAVQDLDGTPSVLYGEIWRDMKTPFHLLYAVNELYKQNPKTRLNVWGLNLARKFWTDMIEHSKFDKFIGKRGLRDTVDYPSQWMSRGDVLVSPCIYGDLSRVGQESMACGCPVIGWDTDPWGDQHAFRYAKPFSIEDLALKIKESYEEVLDDRDAVAKRCREVAVQHFDMNKTAASVVKVLRDVTNNL
jgi:glycosyltransferase involved in cell wall biosynthesis